jgi:hypothetical protein
VDGLAVYLDFDPLYLQVQAITPDTSRLPVTLQSSFDNAAGQINYAAGALSDFPDGTFTVAQVQFLVLAEPPVGSTTLTFHTRALRRTDVTYAGASVASRIHPVAIFMFRDH